MIIVSVWIAFAIQAIALVLFSAGFFEFRQPGVQSNDSERNLEYPEASFDRFVFVLLDALRSDFVFGSDTKFQFLKEKLEESRSAKGFVALAKIPTVTLPRLKALTAGSSPVFLDLILNFDESSLASDAVEIDEKGNKNASGFMQDNWVRSLKQMGRKILMFGDDTWLRLFPDCFERSVPVHSFFVSVHQRFYNKVTEAAFPALKESNWNAIIMHYLGIDHIGHLDGAHSPLMVNKHKEMDTIIKNIYELLAEKDRLDGKKSLILVAGDHGMADNGNHGGSSEKEVSTAAIFLSPSLNFSDSNSSHISTINQVDLVPTISCLLGVPIPQGNTGQLISAVIPKEKLESYQLLNLKQLRVCLGQNRDGNLNIGDQLSAVASELRKSSGGYNLRFMLTSVLLLIPSLVLLFVIRLKIALERRQIMLFSELAFVLFYIFLQTSSSFIEEEHEFWYFSLATLVAIKFLFFGHVGNLLKSFVILILSRIPRNWNSVGNQALQTQDSRIWIQPKTSLANFAVLLALLYGIWNFNKVNRRSNFGRISFLFALIAASLIFAFKSGFAEHDQLLARLCYSSIMAVFATQLYQSIQALQATFYLLFVFLLKPHNVPILAVILALSNYLSSIEDDGLLGNALRIAFMHFSYFALGPSNLIASLDFSNAYIGFSSFNFPLISLITFLITWSGPILASFCLFAHVKRCVHRSEHLVILDVAIWKAFVTTSLLISLVIQRHHLFVWSVFAPRLLFEFGWFLFYSLVFISISIIN